MFEDPDAAKKEREAAKLRDGVSDSLPTSEGDLSRKRKRRRMRGTTDIKKGIVSPILTIYRSFLEKVEVNFDFAFSLFSQLQQIRLLQIQLHRS